MKTIFSMGLGNPSPWNQAPGSAAGIPIYVLTRTQVEASKGHILRRLPVPPGMTVEMPYIVKIEGEGEYLVHADGTATYYDYRAGRWESPQPIDPLAT